MKQLLAFPITMVLLVVYSCGDEPVKPKSNLQNTYSGTFVISDTLDFSSCELPVPLGHSVNVTVEGNSIVFDGFAGTWLESEKRGYGVSPEQTVPITLDCNGYYTVTFDITYTNYDNFYGTYYVDYRYDAACGNDDCFYEFRIGGVRP